MKRRGFFTGVILFVWASSFFVYGQVETPPSTLGALEETTLPAISETVSDIPSENTPSPTIELAGSSPLPTEGISDSASTPGAESSLSSETSNASTSTPTHDTTSLSVDDARIQPIPEGTEGAQVIIETIYETETTKQPEPIPETTTTIIETVYETEQEAIPYEETVTLLQQEDVTVSLPHDLHVYDQEKKQIALDDLILQKTSSNEIKIHKNNIQEISSLQRTSLQTDTIIGEKEPITTTFEFGLPEKHLIFSVPVPIEVQTSFPDGAIFTITAIHAGDPGPSTSSISGVPTGSCTSEGNHTETDPLVITQDGLLRFYTCGASTFTITYTGGANATNYVDNGTKDFTVEITTGVSFPTGSLLNDVDILVDFRPIDNQSPTGPWGTTNCYPTEESFILIHPDGTQVQLANAGTYTTPSTNCPQGQILYDQSAASGIIGGNRNVGGAARQPVGNLNNFNGKSPFGTWTLRMGDSAAQDGVILFGFNLTLKNIECGDGIIGSGESCDDDNLDNGDGCSSVCTLEGGRECNDAPSICTPIPAPTGLRLHYNGSFAGGTFTDISGNGNHGTQYNSVTTGNQNGETVMCFNGTSQYIERATNLATSYPFTMSTWVKTDTISGLHGILSLARSSATNRMYNIEHNTTTMRGNAQNTTARYVDGVTALNTSQWFLITTIFTSNTSRDIYINGVYEGTNTTSVTYDTNTTKRFNVGRLADSSPSNYFDGCLDDIRFYTTALSASQVYTLYAQPATLSTSYTTSASPLLTGTIEGVLDTITITVSGNTYTGVNHGNGTRSLGTGIISPALGSGTYPTTLTITNPYGRFVQYSSSFTVNILPNLGTYCIATPSNFVFTPFATAGYTQTGSITSSGYFQLIDESGANSGYYTTLQMTSLSGSTTTISNSNISRQTSGGVVLLSGTANPNVVIGSAFLSRSPAVGAATFIKRDPAINSGIKGIYGTRLSMRVSLPAYIKPDIYTGMITYTLYEN